jgi:hypothetical protein
MLKKTDKLIDKYKDKGNTKTVKFALPEVWWSINIYYTLIFKILILKKNMSSGPNGTQSAMLDEDEPKICNYTGQLIVEK